MRQNDLRQPEQRAIRVTTSHDELHTHNKGPSIRVMGRWQMNRKVSGRGESESDR
ncbi:MAG: hypothetical protein ACI9R3_005732 [Verrucomicrobiales bacterium]|jgi:hypothetical protein